MSASYTLNSGATYQKIIFAPAELFLRELLDPFYWHKNYVSYFTVVKKITILISAVYLYICKYEMSYCSLI